MKTPFTYIPAQANTFPPWLAEIPHPPRGIFISGQLPPHNMVAIAIVGTRRATPEGKEIAHRFAKQMAACGIVIISGLAFGIDEAAHRGALDGKGKTIAVLPCGTDKIYPRSNERLAQEIFETDGTIVTEYPSGTEPLPYRFLERNRIVSGLARGVLVVEAPESSGALVTGRLAAEQGRDCFVIPGSIHHPNFVGSHELIRKGAELVTKPEDILETYGIKMIVKDTRETEETLQKRFALSENESKILHYLKTTKSPANIDKIITTVNLEPQAVAIAISCLTLKKLIKETAAGYMVE